MAIDFYIDPLTNDLSSIKMTLTSTTEALIRQRLSIRLKTFKGEWFANQDFGLGYFQSIFGKNTITAANIEIRSTI
ncbi:unnamed protein product, partial [marine sediment metagenome]